MGVGKDFEDVLVRSLNDWVDGRGIVMLRRQSMSMRGGDFEGSQEVDIMVDSADRDLYTGFEAKTLNSETDQGKYGFYFSQINPDQFKSQVKYAEISGRDVVVACEARCYGEDRLSRAWLVPLELFTVKHKRGDTKVSWNDIEQFGCCIGTGRDYKIDRVKIESALSSGNDIANKPKTFDECINTPNS
jgi:hypothetical protein